MLPKSLELIHSNPNIYFVRDFMTDHEIMYFDKLCTLDGHIFQNSFTENEYQEEVISEDRTSTYTYLTKGQDSTIRKLEHRAAELAGLTSDCLEPLQVIAYTQGQKFDIHHDAGTLNDDGTVELVMPRRLATLLLYLNTLPEGQGHTEFPGLKLSVRPEKGCGILFCNVLEDGLPDSRTCHRACPVEDNLRKYAVNVWMTDQSFQSLACVHNEKPKKSAGKDVVDLSPGSSAFAKADRAVELHKDAKLRESVFMPSCEINVTTTSASPPSENIPIDTIQRSSDPDETESEDENALIVNNFNSTATSIGTREIDLTGCETEDEDEETLVWSDLGPPGIIGKKLATPYFVWVEEGSGDSNTVLRKRRKVKKNFIGTIVKYAKSERENKSYYKVFYPDDGGLEDITEEGLAESIELYDQIMQANDAGSNEVSAAAKGESSS